MAQVLKEEIRSKILTEARKEFYNRGYGSATLRSIASASGVTVGNLYRYFEGKEHLYEESVSEAYHALNDIIDTRTHHIFTLASDPSGTDITQIDKENANRIIDDVLIDLEDIFGRYHQELIILLKESRSLTDDSRYKILHWFKRLFRLIYPELDFPIYIASGFLASIVEAAEKEQKHLTPAITEIVRFYLLKGGAAL